MEQEIIAKQLVSQLQEFIIFNIPWGHNLRIIAKSLERRERMLNGQITEIAYAIDEAKRQNGEN